MFQLQEFYNQQNERVCAVSLSDIPREKIALNRF
jgi:hypothetical protein